MISSYVVVLFLLITGKLNEIERLTNFSEYLILRYTRQCDILMCTIIHYYSVHPPSKEILGVKYGRIFLVGNSSVIWRAKRAD